VFLLRVQDYLNYRWEREALEERAEEEQNQGAQVLTLGDESELGHASSLS
jgi:hypothetical protein